MKIMFSISSMNCGGAERVVSVLANSLSDEGHHVLIVAHDWEKSFYKLNESIEYISIHTRYKRFGFLCRVFGLRETIKSKQPDIIISFIADHNIVSCIANCGLRSKLIVCERNDPRKRPTRKVLRILRNVVYNAADGFVFQTTDERDYFSRKVKDRSTIILNPIDTSILPPISRTRRNEIISTSRLCSQKRIENIVFAFSQIIDKHPEYRLIIYGEGPEKQKLEKICKENNLENHVLFKGQSSRIYEEIRNARIYVLASDFEGLPNTLIEAMVMGLACVSTDCPVGGPRSIIKSGENGLLVPVNDINAIRDSILRLIESEEYCSMLSQNAFLLREKVAVNSILSQWMSYIKRIIKND